MNVCAHKVLIVALLVFYLGWETSAAAIGGPFKCGNLECPNGSVCEIKENPSNDKKTVTKTAQCKNAEGTVLAEETITEVIPDGKIPFTSVQKKTVKEDDFGQFYGSSYSGSYKEGGEGCEGIFIEPIEFDDDIPFGFDDDVIGIGSAFDGIFSKPIDILNETRDWLGDIFSSKFLSRFW